MSVDNVALAEFMSDRGNITKRNALLASVEKLVYNIAHKYRGRNSPIFEDLVQAGWEGAINAIDSIQGEKEITFASYISYYIRGYMKNFIVNNVFTRASKSSDKVGLVWHMWELTSSPTHGECQALADKYGYHVKDVINQLALNYMACVDEVKVSCTDDEPIDVTIEKISLKAEELFPGKGFIIIQRILDGEAWIDIEKSYELPGKTIRRMLTQLQEFV